MTARFLLLEDKLLDAKKIESTLINGGIDCELLRVETRSNFVSALETEQFDLILAAYALADLDHVSALEIASRLCPDIPFIVISARLGEELAIETLKRGATDYVLKQRLERLVPCVERALREAEERRERKRAELMLIEQKQLLELIATGYPLNDCLSAVCASLFNLNSHLRACFLLTDAQRQSFPRSITPNFPSSFGQGLKDAPIDQLCIGTCGEAVYRGEPITCSDIANDERWSQEWRSLCLAHGILACHSKPVMGVDGLPLGSLMLCFDEARMPTDWEYQLAEFGSQVASVAFERDRLNQQLTDRVNELQTLFDLLPIGVAIAEDPECQRIRVNPYLSNLIHVPVDANASQSAPPAERPVYRLCRDGKDIPVEDLPMQYAARHNTEVRDAVIDVVHPDGTTVNLLSYCSPLRDQQGSVRGVIGGFVDITQRLQNEAILRENEERLKIALQTGKFGSWQLDLTTGVLESSDQCKANFGLSPKEDLSCQRLFELIHPDDRAYVQAVIERAITEQIDYDAEYRTIWLDGSVHWIVDRGRVIYETNGRPVRMIGVTLDITERKQVEETLRKSEERLRLAMEGAQMGTWDFDLLTGKAIWSELHFTMLGYEPTPTGEATGAMWSSQIHPDDVEWVMQEWQQACQERRLYEAEYRIIRADNQQLAWLAALGSFTYNENGEAVRSIGVLFDITERKQTELALTAQEQRYRYIFEAVGVSIWEEDFSEVKAAIDQLKAAGVQDFRQYFREHPEFVQRAVAMVHLRDVNQSSLHLFGAQTKADLLNSLHQIFTPETEEAFVEELLAIAAEETYFAAETVLQTLQGERLHIWFTITFPPSSELYDRVLVSLLNITDRKQAEENLRLSENRYRTLANAVAQLVWINDANGNMQFYNQQWQTYTGVTDLEVGVALWPHIIHPDDFQPTLEARTKAIQAGEAYEVECRLKRADQTYRWHLARVVPLKDDRGQILYWFGTATDIDDRKQVEAERERLLAREQAAREAAEAANRIKDEFLAVVSHELRAPLNPIVGWAKLLRTGQLDEQRTERALEVIERNAQMQAQLINDLLDVSRILRGKLSLETRPVDLAATIQAAMETVRLAAEAKSIQIYTMLDPQVGQVAGDAGRLQQVIWNLLSNAVKFTSEGGRVEIRLEQVDRQDRDDREDEILSASPVSPAYARITVTDTGKGIHPDFLPYVFDHFRQESSTTTRRFGGLGLGLAIVRYLVELHGGTVQADSPGEGQGATFTVTLPLMPHQPAMNLDTAPFESSLNLQGIRILVVDDDDNTREFLTFLLELHQANVIAVASADEAVASLTQFQPDLLLSDIGMPNVDGYMLMRQVRALPPEQGGQIPAIALTAYAGEIDYQQAMAAGFQKHMPKPIEPAKLVEAIASLVQPRQ